jgi:hypothetical protein
MLRARHLFADLVLTSALPLPELPAAGDARATCSFELASPGPLAEVAPAGAPACQIPGGGGVQGFVIVFAGAARFTVSAPGDAIVCTPVAGTAPATLRHLLIDQVLPRVLFLRGAVVLHASALRAPDGRAVAFLGASGSGKSTLAASLLAAGWSLLTDDALVIQSGRAGPSAVPTYPELRLWPDVAAWLGLDVRGARAADAGPKLRLRAAGLGDKRPFSTVPVPLARIYLVEAGREGATAPTVRAVPGGEGLTRAFEGEFRLAAVDRRSLQTSFDRIVSSGVLPLLRSLSYPRGREALSALHAEIRRDLAAA